MKTATTSFNRSIIMLLMLTVALIIYWASANALWLGDDYFYQFLFEEDHTPLGDPDASEIRSIADVFVSQFNHYFTYNGRCVAHFFVQLFCGLLGQTAFASFNGLAYIVLIYCILTMGGGNVKDLKCWITASILVLLSLCTKMTPSTQIGYIWMAIPNLIFIKKFLEGRSHGMFALSGLAVLALISGNSHEAYSIGISLGIILYFLSNFKNFGKTRYVMAIAYGIGALFVCLSPAALRRAGEHEGDLFQSLFFFVFSLRAIYLLVFIAAYKLITKKMALSAMYRKYSFYWNVMLGCIVFNLCVGVFCNRQLFGAELMAIILIMQLLTSHAFSTFWLGALGILTCVFTALQIERTVLHIRQKERIFKKFEQSESGNVYQDTWGTGLIEEWPTYLWENGFHSRSFRWLMARKYPGRPTLNVLPVFLEGKDSLDMGNVCHHYNYKPGKLILIQSKENPGKFIVERKFFGIVPYQQREVDFSDCVYETDKWKAVIYDELWPVIKNTDVKIIEQETDAQD